MKVTLLCSDSSHPVNAYLSRWMTTLGGDISVELVRKRTDCSGGDLLFLISCSEIITRKERDKYGASLVLHASSLPKGRGWSPHVWQIIEGAEGISVSLLEAEDAVDTGKIWTQIYIPVPAQALFHEINEILFEAELRLLDFAVANYGCVIARDQESEGASYYRRRTPLDSELDVHKSIAEQFDLIRVCDPQRYPAHFNFRGRRYILKLEKYDAE